ncbi:MAG: DUF4931 domain-containing protein [Chitinophagales bacterium]
MPELRRDMVRGNWVVIATERSVRPGDLPVPSHTAPGGNLKTDKLCPFCGGNESMTPSEIAVVRPEGTEKDGPGWIVRAFPNKFPAFRSEASTEHIATGVYTHQGNYGAHEVIVETPLHNLEFYQHSSENLTALFKVLGERYRVLSSNERIKYIQIYKNHGLFAGASLSHSHTQIAALPYVPDQAEGLEAYQKETGHCLYCDIVRQDLEERGRLVLETSEFVVLCPYASRFPYETWIVPRKHCEDFGQISPEQIQELADISRRVVAGLIKLVPDLSYNLIVNTSPINDPARAGRHWLVEIWPRLIVNSGVEIASGCYINPVAPEWAAESLAGALPD